MDPSLVFDAISAGTLDTSGKSRAKFVEFFQVSKFVLIFSLFLFCCAFYQEEGGEMRITTPFSIPTDDGMCLKPLWSNII